MSLADPPSLSDAHEERFCLFLTGLQLLIGGSDDLLIAAGVLPDAIAARRFRDNPFLRLLDLDDAAQCAFWLLVERTHTERVIETARAAAAPPSSH